MKKSMIHKMAAVALLAAPLFNSCSQDDALITRTSQTGELKVEVGLYDVQTRAHVPYTPVTPADPYKYGGADNPDHFKSTHKIGLFIRKANSLSEPYWFNNAQPSDPADYTGPYENIEYTAVGNWPTQTWTTPSSVILHNTINAKICGYHLVNYPGTDNGYKASLSYDKFDWQSAMPVGGWGSTPPSAPLNMGLECIDTFDIHCNDGYELLYCPFTTTTVNGSAPAVKLTFKHAQALLRLSVQLAPGFSGAATMTEFIVSGDFGVEGTYSIPKGTYKINWSDPSDPVVDATEEYKIQWTSTPYDLSESGDGKWSSDYFVLPKPSYSADVNDYDQDGENGTTTFNFSVSVGGVKYTAKLNDVKLKRGWIYTIPLVISNHGLLLSEVDITPWNFQTFPIVPLVPAGS